MVTLADLLQFATGADKIPSLGFFPRPTVVFLHPQGIGEEEKHTAGLPRANTCGMELSLPVLDRYVDFRDRMVAEMITTFTTN